MQDPGLTTSRAWECCVGSLQSSRPAACGACPVACDEDGTWDAPYILPKTAMGFEITVSVPQMVLWWHDHGVLGDPWRIWHRPAGLINPHNCVEYKRTSLATSVAKYIKLHWESKPNRKKYCILQTLQPHPHNRFIIFKSLTSDQVTKACLLRVCMQQWQKLAHSVFFQSVHKIHWSIIKMTSDSSSCRNGLKQSYTYHLLFKEQHLDISYILHPQDATFVSSSYSTNENGFGHTLGDC